MIWLFKPDALQGPRSTLSALSGVAVLRALVSELSRPPGDFTRADPEVIRVRDRALEAARRQLAYRAERFPSYSWRVASLDIAVRGLEDLANTTESTGGPLSVVDFGEATLTALAFRITHVAAVLDRRMLEELYSADIIERYKLADYLVGPPVRMLRLSGQAHAPAHMLKTLIRAYLSPETVAGGGLPNLVHLSEP